MEKTEVGTRCHFTCDANIYLSVYIMGVKDIMFFLNIFKYLLLFNFVHGKFA